MLALLAAVLRAPLAGAAEDLGRLFFTPQQRQDLDRRRAANAQEAAAIVQESTLTASRAGYRVPAARRPPGSTACRSRTPMAPPTRLGRRIRTGEDEPEVTLKVGETRDLVRGETRDGLAGGKIKVNPRTGER